MINLFYIPYEDGYICEKISGYKNDEGILYDGLKSGDVVSMTFEIYDDNTFRISSLLAVEYTGETSVGRNPHRLFCVLRGH